MEKNSYERRSYESVDEKSLLLGYISKIQEKQNSGTNGLNVPLVSFDEKINKHFFQTHYYLFPLSKN